MGSRHDVAVFAAPDLIDMGARVERAARPFDRARQAG
jgi:hypothetical protein